MSKDKQARRFQLTINNPHPEFTHDRIKELCTTKFRSFRYAAMTDEIGEQGTYHTHIFLCFDSAVRFSTLKKQFSTAHIETTKGSIQQNIDYLLKSGKWENTVKSETTVEGTFEELGERPPENKGKRVDLEELYHMIVDEELSNDEIIMRNTDYILQIDKLDKIRTTYLQAKFRDVQRIDLEVIYIFGTTGSGKTRGILGKHGTSNVYRVTDYKHPFDGYSNEPVIVFEEFRSSLPLQEMLNYLDIYPIPLTARYNNKYACYNKVYLCSNWELERQYAELQKADSESWNAFLRRIHHVSEYTSDGIIEYSSVSAYLERNNKFIPVEQLSKQEQKTLTKLFPAKK